MKTIIQDLKLKAGEKATCTAGYPHKGTIVVECTKDFDSAPSSDHIIDNTSTYVKVIEAGRFGALTSHWISCNWRSLPIPLINNPKFNKSIHNSTFQ